MTNIVFRFAILSDSSALAFKTPSWYHQILCPSPSARELLGEPPESHSPIYSAMFDPAYYCALYSREPSDPDG
ncbi:hypothetical protein BDV09DRAFT_171355 [Aspergillus tetrazonus]